MNIEQALDLIKKTVNGRDVNNFNTRVPHIQFSLLKDNHEIHNFKLSVQASGYHYCEPRENCDEYDKVEIGYPNFEFTARFITTYAEDKDNPTDTVYGYVPIEELASELAIFCEKFVKGEV